MKAQLATAALVSLMPWSSSAAPAQTERRGCRAGYSFNLTSDLCELCPSGTFTDTYNWENRCQPCSPCSEGRQLVAPCNASSNTVCRCADDHYEHEDGCSPKTGTTRSEIEELNPILQGIKKQIGMEAQKSQDKVDNLANAVDVLRKDIVSGAYAEEAFQAKTVVLLGVVVAFVVLLFLLVSAMLIAQHYLKLVDLFRCQRCCGHGSKDKKEEKRDQPSANKATSQDDSHAAPPHGHGGASSQQKEKHAAQGEHSGSVVSDGTPRAQSKGTSGGADIELRKMDTGALAVADSDESPTTSNFKTEVTHVELTNKERCRNRTEADIPLHGNPNEEMRSLLQSNDRNCHREALSK